MPVGIPVPTSKTRPTVSAKRRRRLPSSILAGMVMRWSLPNQRRVIWPAISPTKVMLPTRTTLSAPKAVAKTKVISLSFCKCSPRAMAVWSLRFIMLRDRQRLKVTNQTEIRRGLYIIKVDQSPPFTRPLSHWTMYSILKSSRLLIMLTMMPDSMLDIPTPVIIKRVGWIP